VTGWGGEGLRRAKCEGCRGDGKGGLSGKLKAIWKGSEKDEKGVGVCDARGKWGGVALSQEGGWWVEMVGDGGGVGAGWIKVLRKV